jgi:hypothetical protein
MKAISVAAGVALALLTPSLARATANYVYHEQTTNSLDAPVGTACGDYLPTTTPPTSSQTYPLEFKIEYEGYTDTAEVYYTTDGTTPSGAFGVASGTSSVVSGDYFCTFLDPLGSGNNDDAVSATLPALPAGTVVHYIVSAWHTGGGAEVFANSGTCSVCTACTTSSCATVFTYTVASSTDAGAEASSDSGSGDDASTDASSTSDAALDAAEEASREASADASAEAAPEASPESGMDAAPDASADATAHDGTADTSTDTTVNDTGIMGDGSMVGEHHAVPDGTLVGTDGASGDSGNEGTAPSSSGCGCTIPGGDSSLSLGAGALYAVVALAARRRAKDARKR